MNGHRSIRGALVVVILVAALVLMWRLPFEQLLASVRDWIAGLGAWGPIALAVVYVLATVLFVPGTILTLAAGAMFGLTIGMITVSIASTVGASLAFLIARYGARDWVASVASRNSKFDAIDRAIGEGGWKIVAMLRLSPAIPFNLQNYLYGLTQIRFWPYVLTSWLAMMPGTFLYVYLGHITGAAVAGERSRTPAEWALLAVGLLATLLVTVYITRLARSKLQEQIDSDNKSHARSETDIKIDAAPQEDHAGKQSGAGIGATLLLASVALALVIAAVYASLTGGAFLRS